MEEFKYLNSKNKRIYGLTGSIATGKSFVSSLFSNLGVEIIDADQLSRAVVSHNSPILEKISNLFGPLCINNDGSLNRKHIRELIINDNDKRNKLNSIIHPAIISLENEKIKNSNSRIIIVDAALLIETESYKRFEKIILVYTTKELQIKRLMERENINRNKAIKTIEMQLSINEKRKFADYIIDNSGSKEDTKKQVNKLYELL